MAKGGSKLGATARKTKRVSSRESQSLPAMAKAALEAAKQNSHAPRTVSRYKQHIKNAREWIKAFASPDKLKEATKAAYAAATGSSTVDPEDEIDSESAGDKEVELDPDFIDAFDGSPKACTSLAIGLYLWWKCIHGGCKAGTADQVYSAFIKHYNDQGDSYRGQWTLDRTTGEYFGNPARSAHVQDMMTAIKHMGGEPERRHSRAMSKDDMETLHEHIDTQCPGPEKQDRASKMARAEYLEFKALSALGFTIWTRNCETVQLQFRDFDFSQKPKKASNGKIYPFIVVNLRNRKNWQRKMAKGDHQLSGHVYHLYPKQHSIALDAYTAIIKWKECYEDLIGRPLEDDDVMFPRIGANATVHTKLPLTSDAVQKKLTQITSEAGLANSRRFTTHCFRRGGAQYRYMFAPPLQRWKMNRIRWWGGWAEKESKNTLIRYLLDELNTYEEGHVDALCPDDEIAGNCELGDDPSDKPLTQADADKIIDTVTARVSEALEKGNYSRNTSTPPGYRAPSQHHSQSAQGMPSSSSPPYSQTQPPPYPAAYPSQPSSLSAPPVFPPSHVAGFAPPSQGPGIQHWQGYWPMLPYPPPFIHGPVPPASLPRRTVSSTQAWVVPRVNLRPCDAHKAWLQVVDDWEKPNTGRSPLPLNQWDEAWLPDSNQRMQFRIRKLIALEFIDRYVSRSHETSFLNQYPEADNGMTALYRAILKEHQRRGTAQTRARRS
ncbi:hypothetical protein BKA70DRAFT_1123277 [Coprinopsis sp. MPI-PUGE-AT-0042]|nr:hypothetical protein BKA70DRAFT_1123277 [Coprinopsis sp. MPI-PUGE-AT-0042]